MRLVNKGMGGFLNPPGDAEHEWSVKDIGDRCSMSLRYALTQSYVSDSLKEQIRAKLAEHPGQLTEAWVRECYAYFRNCYSPDGTTREVGKLATSGPPEWHAAHLHIVEFFPDYSPRTDLHGPQNGTGPWGAKTDHDLAKEVASET